MKNGLITPPPLLEAPSRRMDMKNVLEAPYFKNFLSVFGW
jgi:hypothetical protein